MFLTITKASDEEIGKNVDYSANEKHKKAALVLLELLQYLYDNFYGKKMPISKEAECMKKYIEEHISQNIALKELSDLVYLSESQVIRSFKREFGLSPHEYSLNLKLEQAKKLLRNTTLMVREIAEYLGFCDAHYFSYIFKHKTGKTPLEYRRNVR